MPILGILVAYVCEGLSGELYDYCIDSGPDKCSFTVPREFFDRVLNYVRRFGQRVEKNHWTLKIRNNTAEAILHDENNLEIIYYTDMLEEKCENVLQELEQVIEPAY